MLPQTIQSEPQMINRKKIKLTPKNTWQQLLESKTEHVLQESLQVLSEQCALFAREIYEKLAALTLSIENNKSFMLYKCPFKQKNEFLLSEEFFSFFLKNLRHKLNCLDRIILPGNALSLPLPFFNHCTLNQAMQEQLFTLAIAKWAEKKNKQALNSSLQEVFLPVPSSPLKIALKAVIQKISPNSCLLDACGCSHSQEKSRYTKNKQKRLLGISKRWEHQLYHYWEKQLVDYIYAKHEDLANNLF